MKRQIATLTARNLELRPRLALLYNFAGNFQANIEHDDRSEPQRLTGEGGGKKRPRIDI